MTIRSDNWIRQMCMPATHIHSKPNGVPEYISEPFSPHQIRVIKATEARRALLSCTVIPPNVANGAFFDVQPKNPNVDEMEDKLLFDPLIETIIPVSGDPTLEKIVKEAKPMIVPFINKSIKRIREERCCSFGSSSFGYDARLHSDLKLFTNINSSLIDPYDVDEDCYTHATIREDEKGREYAILPPNSFMLGRTMEWFNIPRDVLVICMSKSTWARAGISVLVTPLEPEWSGHVVIEIANHTTMPAKIYVKAGICQFLFLQSDENCSVSYADRDGKYQNQVGITMGKV